MSDEREAGLSGSLTGVARKLAKALEQDNEDNEMSSELQRIADLAALAYHASETDKPEVQELAINDLKQAIEDYEEAQE